MRLYAPALVSLVVLFSCGQAPGALGQGFGPSAVGATCTSGQAWLGGSSESALMNPGSACRACHLSQEPGKAYFFMGTAYPSPHESDLCAAADVPSDAVVEILDTNDVVQVTMAVNAAGNFRSRSTTANLPMPYKARVRAGGKTTAMGASQTNGDCNSCHTAAGAEGAPGRVLFPQ